ncbi:MAG: class I SAM-dependent methyltransferase [bacterium]|nr:MAG: class I SAM-dependent methyltransferase [bacterium]
MADGSDPRDTFSRSAERYLHSTEHRSGPDLEVIRKAAAGSFPALVLDVASGAGHALRAAAPYSGVCIAADLTMEMLRVTKAHLDGLGLGPVLCVQSGAEALPLADGRAGLVTCRIAPHHFASVPPFLREVARVLAPEGQFILVDSLAPAGDTECDSFINKVERFRDPSHVRSYTSVQWEGFFRDAGLRILLSEVFEKTHVFREWAGRVGLDEEGIRALERMFAEAPARVRRRFKVRQGSGGSVTSYTDEKGMWILKKSRQASSADPDPGPAAPKAGPR